MKKPLQYEVLTQEVAERIAFRKPMREIAEELKISVASVSKIANSKECKSLVLEITTVSLVEVKQQIKKRTSMLVNKIMKVIEDQLDQGNLEAVKVGLKVLGFNDQEAVTGSQNLTVVLPGSVDNNTIEVKQDDI